MIVVVMGVTGSGKTTIGALLAEALHCAFLDGDKLHSPANVAKMAAGIPLSDQDRQPWLMSIHRHITAAFARGEDLVVACSALKEAYRHLLAQDADVTWVHLTGAPDLIRSRLLERRNHFAKANLLDSQLDALEPPHDAIVVDVTPPPEQIVARILTLLERRP